VRKLSKAKIKPEIVAAITAALTAGGVFDHGGHVADVRKRHRRAAASPWKMAGLKELMRNRQFHSQDLLV